MTFTRSNDTATRVGPNGYIEKVRTNLLLQSNTFNRSWSNTRSTESSGYAGYDGTNNAWKLEEDSNTGTHLLEQNVVSSAGVHTISCYFKAAERSGVQFLLEGSASYAFANFNLSTGEVYSSGQIGSFTLIEAKITSIGGGWYRCSVSASTNVATSWFKIYTLDAGFNTSYTGTTGEGIYIQDAQLEVGSVATDYIETTTAAVSVGPLANVPRINFDPVLPRTGSLLLEPQRTNLFEYSEYMNGLDLIQATATQNADISPEGIQNAARLYDNTVDAQHRVGDNAMSVTSGTTYTLSVFAKKGTLRYCYLLSTAAASTERYFFDLQEGTAITSGGTIEDYGNGWYRLSAQSTASATGNAAFAFNLTNEDQDNTYVGTGTDYHIVYGLQLEAGSYPTSYIPTYSTAVTRGADACSKTGISSLIGQTEGTIFVEFKDLDYSDASIARAVAISDGTYNNRIYISQLTSGAIYVAGITSGTLVLEIQESAPSSRRGTIKAALAYKNNDCALYVNGTLAGTDTSTTTPACSRIDFGQATGGGVKLYKPYNQVLLFQTRLTNDQLSQITTL